MVRAESLAFGILVTVGHIGFNLQQLKQLVLLLVVTMKEEEQVASVKVVAVPAAVTVISYPLRLLTRKQLFYLWINIL